MHHLDDRDIIEIPAIICRVGDKIHALPGRNVHTCSILSRHARTVPRLYMEQADKQMPEVRSSDLVTIGHGNSSPKAEPMQLRFQRTILYSHACTCTVYTCRSVKDG